MSSCGLDFGTSNTTLGSMRDGVPSLLALESGQTTIPSAIFYELDGAVLIGRRAIEAYVDGTPGRLMRSLKSVLGTALIDETTQVGRERSSFRDVIAWYLGAVKRRAEQAVGRRFRSVVHGRPVHFVDNAPAADSKAEAAVEIGAADAHAIVGENVALALGLAVPLGAQPHDREIRRAAADVGNQRDLLTGDLALVVERGRDRLELERDVVKADLMHDGAQGRFGLAVGSGRIVDEMHRPAVDDAAEPAAGGLLGAPLHRA